MPYVSKQSGSLENLLKVTAESGYVVIAGSYESQVTKWEIIVPHEQIGTFIKRLELAREAAALMEAGQSALAEKGE